MGQQAGKPEVHMMVDFESLGVSRDSVVLSCGIVLFDLTGKIHKEVYIEFLLAQQIADGRTINPSTVAWWQRTDKDELLRLCSDELPHKRGTLFLNTNIEGILRDFKVKKVWSRGPLDFEMLNDLIEKPFPYWVQADVRTLDIFPVKFPTNSHNALQDCRNQIIEVTEVYKRWNSVPNVEPQTTLNEKDAPTATTQSFPFRESDLRT